MWPPELRQTETTHQSQLDNCPHGGNHGQILSATARDAAAASSTARDPIAAASSSDNPPDQFSTAARDAARAQDAAAIAAAGGPYHRWIRELAAAGAPYQNDASRMTPDQIDALVEDNIKLQHQLTIALGRIDFLYDKFRKGVADNSDLRRQQVKLDGRIQNLETEV